MARVRTKGLERGELMRLTSHGGARLSLWRPNHLVLEQTHVSLFSGNEALRALARAILREVPAQRKRRVKRG